MTISYFYCAFCNYKSKRNYDLKRHQNAVHKSIIENVENERKDIQTEKKDIQHEIKDIQPEIKDNLNKNEIIYSCKKCYKKYKTKKNYLEHEKKCIGIDILTCSRCMYHFSSYGNKSKHMKKIIVSLKV